jgi:hypothetical protein
VHTNFKTSGRLDTSAQSFLGELVSFLPALSGGGERAVTDESRRVALLFVCYQVGTPQEMTELINFSSRTAPNDVRIEDSVTGEPTNTAPRRKRRREVGSLHTAASGGVDNVRALV